MQIYHGIEALPAELTRSVVTIGNFDGVHLGHRHVLHRVAELADQKDATSIAVTFDPHPAVVHRPDEAPALLTGLDEKIRRIGEANLQAVLVLPYNLELAHLTPEEFIGQYFVDALKTVAVVVGHDVRFGRQNSGDFNTMVQLGESYGFSVEGIDDFTAGPSEQRCSSTDVRQALAAGDVADAALMLGRFHSVTGVVVHGQARGRELGFPTANLAQDAEGKIPADGVYAGWINVEADNEALAGRWPAAISVGSNPTFEGVQRVVEAHVINRPQEELTDFDLYGHRARVEFVQRLRGMVAYEGVEKLVEQMRQDVSQTREVLQSASL